MSTYTDVYRYRELFGSLLRRDLEAKYKGTVLGVVWSLANPLLLMAIYLVVFSLLWQVIDQDYPGLFLLTGLVLWVFFANSLQAASKSLLEAAALIRKTRFPRQLVPLSSVATNLVAFFVMFAVVLVLNFAFLPRVRATEWVAIPLAAVFVLLVAGLSLAVACATVVFRDVEHLVSALLLPWFFLTPILYTIDRPAGRGRGVRLARRRPPVGERPRAAGGRDPRPALLRRVAGARRRGLPLRRRCRRRSRSARGRSVASTTGWQSNSDPPVVERGLAVGRHAPRAAPRPRSTRPRSLRAPTGRRAGGRSRARDREASTATARAAGAAPGSSRRRPRSPRGARRATRSCQSGAGERLAEVRDRLPSRGSTTTSKSSVGSPSSPNQKRLSSTTSIERRYRPGGSERAPEHRRRNPSPARPVVETVSATRPTRSRSRARRASDTRP